jgi:anti-anti-sigma factor
MHMTPTATPHHFAVYTRLAAETTIVLRGELDLAAVEAFQTLVDGLEFSSLQRVVLDLEQLAFIDVSGLRAVLRLYAACLDESVPLTITPGPSAVQRLFELTQTDRCVGLLTTPGCCEAVDVARPPAISDTRRPATRTKAASRRCNREQSAAPARAGVVLDRCLTSLVEVVA